MKYLLPVFFTLSVPFALQGQKVAIGHTVPLATIDVRGVGASPTIPGATSTGIARFGVNPIEGIDIGKMNNSPFIGWIQVGFNGTTDPLSLQPLGGNVGIGTINPGSALEVIGQVTITGGSPGAGKILTSNATGLASWQPPPPPPGTNDPSVSICCQRWMTKNLDVATYRNGDAIPKVTSDAAWAALTTGAYCYFNNDSATYAATYGKLYNWYAVTDSRGLAPEGWYIPSDFEYTTLGNCLGAVPIAGGLLKEAGTIHWSSPNTGATNQSAFTGLPGGFREDEGGFFEINTFGFWWSLTGYSPSQAWSIYLSTSDSYFYKDAFGKKYGFSVRCLRD